MLVLVVFRLCWDAATAGERDLPFPRIRPPPSDRREEVIFFAGDGVCGAYLLERWVESLKREVDLRRGERSGGGERLAE